LIGTWQFMGVVPGVTRTLKHVTPTHVFTVRLTDKDVVESGQGGPYTLANGTYTESIVYGFGPRFEAGRGANNQFQCSLDGDVWHIAGKTFGRPLNEQWKRVSATPQH
jgi:hypothetical protein